MRSKRHRRRRAAPAAAPTLFARLKALWLALIGRKPGRLTARAAGSTVDDATRPRNARPDFEPTRVVRRSGDDDDEADWLPASRAVGVIEVTEEAMHTLPAELQDEFNRPPQPPKPPPAPSAAAADAAGNAADNAVATTAATPNGPGKGPQS